MATSTSGISLSGIGSGYDYETILTKLEDVEYERLTTITDKVTLCSEKISAWESFTTLLTTLQTATDELKSGDAFEVYSPTLSSSSSVSAESLLSVSTTSSASSGTYEIVINNKAQAEKLASNSFSSKSSALNISGSILVNGRSVQIESTDTLEDLKTEINSVNSGTDASGVSASIVNDSDGSYRLVLTSETTGASGISLLNGSASDALASLGFNGSGTVIKNSVAGGAQSDALSSSSTAVEALLGTESEDLSGTVTINGKTVTIDLSDSLETIKDNMVAAGISASIVEETNDDSETTYRLEVEGMTNWTDQNNVLQALGFIEGSRDSEVGVTGSVANTSDGSTAITEETLITDIYGYNTYTAGDKITISGVAHDGTAVTATDFAIDSTTTVGDLLARVEELFGDVTAKLTSEGEIEVIDNATGSSQLSVNLQSSLVDANAGILDFGSFGDVGTVHQYVLRAGEDAEFTIDGMTMTSSSNTITTAIPGATLNIAGEDSGTTVTLNIDRDVEAIEENVNSMLDAYNAVIAYVNEQMTYNSDSEETGGVLFGDNTLKSIKSQLQNLMLTQVGTGTIKYMTDIGITINDDNEMVLDSGVFEGMLATNLEEVESLFMDSASCSDSNFQYVYSGASTQSGTYHIDVTQLSGTDQTIAGTIDGLAATGWSDTLTLNDSSSDAYGLEIRYTGSTVPASADITFTRGIASLVGSLIDELTDSIDGTITLQTDSLDTTATMLTAKATDMETQIAAKMALYRSQFEAMDSAVAEMQSMADYLESQFDS
ncbi:MAG: flagellar filament capping protein FliD [Syntrophobacteraceae bacterium]